MIIVSQDKSVIVNFNNVEAIEIGNVEENQCKGIIYARLVSAYFYKIGEYKTEERALEVLNEIQQVFTTNKAMELYAQLGDMREPNKRNYSYTPCYQLPKE